MYIKLFGKNFPLKIKILVIRPLLLHWYHVV